MGKKKDEAANLQLLLNSAQEKDVRLGLHLAAHTDVSLDDLTHLVLLALMHASEEVRELAMEALQRQTIPLEFAEIMQNWDPTYLAGRNLSVLDALFLVGESDRIDQNELLRKAVRMHGIFPTDAVHKYPQAFLTFCETILEDDHSLILSRQEIPCLPKEISQSELFKNLTHLYLEKCKMNQIPREIRALKKLKVLDLSENQLGDLPKEIGELGTLEELNLRQNPLKVFPEALPHLPRLQTLHIKLGKDIDYHSIAKCKHLKTLHAPDSQHPNPFPILSKMPSLEVLNFYVFPGANPMLDTKVPGGWKKLRQAHLKLREDQPFPRFITQVGQLENLNIHHVNEFPDDCFPVPQPQLSRIELYQVMWKQWPESWSEFPALKSFYVQGRHLRELPERLGNSQELRSLTINCPFPTAPSFLTSLKNLNYLHLGHTEIVQLPEDFCELINLKSLFINAGQLRKLPESLKKMTWLEKISLSNLRLNKQDVLDLKAALPNTVVDWY